MEGALLVIKSWALVGSLLWLYRRYIERVARPDAEFEAWCRGAPRIAALRGESADLASVEAALGLLLGRRSRVIATLGGCPWPDYELELRVTLRGSALELSVVRAELRRVHGATPPSLVTVLRDALNEHPAISDAWLLSETVYGKLGPDEAPHGWQL